MSPEMFWALSGFGLGFGVAMLNHAFWIRKNTGDVTKFMDTMNGLLNRSHDRNRALVKEMIVKDAEITALEARLSNAEDLRKSLSDQPSAGLFLLKKAMEKEHERRREG